MDPNQFFQILQNASSPDHNARTQAQAWIQEAEKSQYPLFVQLLVTELTNNERPEQYRQLVGLVLKNSLTAKDDTERHAKAQRWLTLDQNLRFAAKNAVLNLLGAPIRAVSASAAQSVAKIAAIELPRNAWPELVNHLLNNMQQENDPLKQATLETLGYVCEDLDTEVLTPQSNQILTAVCKGMRENNNDVKFAGCVALFNALPFIQGNFEKEVERSYIMQVVCEAAACPDLRVRVAAFECIAEIAENFYDKLAAYMHKLFNLTLEAIKRDDPKVALQAIEFWSTICDEEINIAVENEEAVSMKMNPTRTSQNFIKGALQFLVPLLTECLTRQEENADEDEWNVPMSAATCLGLISTTVEDEVVNHVMPFVNANIKSENWKLREAATLAFGAILEGPKTHIPQLTIAALPVFLSHLKDPVEIVRDSTAWAIGRIIMLHPSVIGSGAGTLMQAFLESLKDTPRVTALVCWCIHNLALVYEDDQDNTTSVLSQFFGPTLQALLQVTEREDIDEGKLRASAYEAMNVIVQCGAADTLPIVGQIVPIFIQKLEATFAMQIVSMDDKEEQNAIQSLVCSMLQVSTHKLGEQIKPFADRMMTLYLQVFSSKNATLHEECLMAVGALANAVETDFEKYMPHFLPFLLQGLKAFDETQVVSSAVGVVGDVSRALAVKIAPFCDEIVKLLLMGLQNPAMDRYNKILIISVFGDIALAISGGVINYLGAVMPMLLQASATTVDMSDPDLVDYLNRLREAIFEACTGIVQGLRTDNVADPHLLPYINGMVHFCASVAADNKKTDEVTAGALGLLGDIASALGPKVKQQLTQAFVKSLINDGQKGGEKSQELAKWAKGEINKL